MERIHPLLRGHGAALVHLNYLSDAALAALVGGLSGNRPCVPVYCPRASAYFGHPAPGHAAHRYRDLLAAGVPVAIGTDSAILLGDAPSISVLDELRFLHRRDATDPRTLVAMATAHGARAIGVDPMQVRLPKACATGARALVAVRLASGGSGTAEGLLARALCEGAPCEWLRVE